MSKNYVTLQETIRLNIHLENDENLAKTFG